MKPGKSALLFLLAALSLCLTPDAFQQVKYIYDGDTVLLKGGDKVRYLGINAPEIDHGGGKDEFMACRARDYNLDLVKGARVRLEYDQETRDRHGRLLAYVFLEKGDMVNALLVRKGLAYVMINFRTLRYRDLLIDCQRKAMREKLGIWRRTYTDKERFYLGNRTSYRFHRPSCSFGAKISRTNLRKFMSRHEAFVQGYSPCRFCMP